MMFQKHNLFCPDYKFHMMMRFLIDYATECDLEVNWPLYHCKISETRVTRSSTAINSIIRYRRNIVFNVHELLSCEYY